MFELAAPHVPISLFGAIRHDSAFCSNVGNGSLEIDPPESATDLPESSKAYANFSN